MQRAVVPLLGDDLAALGQRPADELGRPRIRGADQLIQRLARLGRAEVGDDRIIGKGRAGQDRQKQQQSQAERKHTLFHVSIPFCAHWERVPRIITDFARNVN